MTVWRWLGRVLGECRGGWWHRWKHFPAERECVKCGRVDRKADTPGPTNRSALAAVRGGRWETVIPPWRHL